MFRRITWTLLLGCLLIVPALADEPGAAAGTPLLYTAQAALLSLGALFTLLWSYRAFNAPPISFGDGSTPTLPRYMTQPTQYRVGAIGFAGLCLIIYGLIAYFHQEFLPIVKFISPPLYQAIDKSTSDGSLSYPLVVVFAAAIFVALLKFDREWNPLLVLRKVIHGWVSIPQLANALMVMARDELTVPADARAKVVADDDVFNVAIVDFDKGRRSLDRQWAELSYMRYWLNSKCAQGPHLTFFTEPSFAWEKLRADYEHVGVLIAPLKQGSVTDPHIFADVAGKVDALRRQYCRLAACFLIFKNETQKAVLSDAAQFGVQILPPDIERASPLRYIPIYVVAILASVYVGVTLSAMGWDLSHGYFDRVFNQDPDIATRWIGYALSNYGVAILAVLLLRYLGWKVDPSQPGSYVTSYAIIFVVALCIAPPCLSLAVKFLANGPIVDMPYPTLVFTEFKWSISPAVVAVYVAHYLDRQIDPLLPDIRVTEKWWVIKRLLRCVFYALLATAFAIQPTLSIPLDSPGSVSRTDVWEASKLRVVVLGTTFIIAFVMALVGEFCLGKSKTRMQP